MEIINCFASQSPFIELSTAEDIYTNIASSLLVMSERMNERVRKIIVARTEKSRRHLSDGKSKCQHENGKQIEPSSL
jgi:hypothetical protein